MFRSVPFRPLYSRLPDSRKYERELVSKGERLLASGACVDACSVRILLSTSGLLKEDERGQIVTGDAISDCYMCDDTGSTSLTLLTSFPHDSEN